ncbi:MAG TPA: flippase [Bacteroidales bacterium]|nr:flippase [Bacteroidales bacterium]
MPDQSLKKKTVKGVFWNAVDKFGTQAISFVIGIILARILMPSDYGLIGMLAIFFAFSELFVNSGFSSALIQKKDRSEADYSTIFYFNITVAVIFYFVLFFTAPLIARFYNAPQLTDLTRVLSLIIIFNSLSLVQATRLTVNLDFRTQAIVSFTSNIISGITGVIAAYGGLGVWSLVLQRLLYAIIRSFLFFILSRWKPIMIFSKQSFRQLFGFSSKLLGAGVVASFFNNMYSLLIGKFFSAGELGFYTKARQYPEMLSGLITTIHQGVTYPVLASLQDDRERLVSVYGRLMRMIVFFVIPLMTLFAIFSGPFIRVLLTEKWAPAIPLMQWLCFARMITPISALNMNILNAVGRSDLYFRVDISKFPLALLALIVSIPIGLKAIVIGNFIVTFISFFINAYYPGKFYDFGAARQIKEMLPVILATLFAAFAAFGIVFLIPADLLKLIVGIPVAGIIYLLSARLLKIRELDEVLQLINGIINKVRSKNA